MGKPLRKPKEIYMDGQWRLDMRTRMETGKGKKNPDKGKTEWPGGLSPAACVK